VLNNINLSTIIPVYNTDKYLAECIDSVLDQSLDGIEIIIVDDGSTDSSWQIIKKYQDEYPNISGFQQENKRQGAARNLGMKYATGEFIAFLDSDDTVPSYAYEEMYNRAINNKSDLVVGVQQSFNKLRKWVGAPVHQKKFTKIIINTNIRDFPELLSDVGVCNKIIRKELITKNNIVFPEGSAGEDTDFMARAYIHAKSISITPKVVYNYRGRSNSRTGRLSTDFFQNRVQVANELYEVFRQNNYEAIYKYLLRSEIKKLVGNRFTKVVQFISYPEQVSIFKSLNVLIRRLSIADILDSGDYSLREIIRIIMLQYHEYDAIIAFENTPGNVRYISLIKGDAAKANLLLPLVKYSLRKESNVSSYKAYSRHILRLYRKLLNKNRNYNKSIDVFAGLLKYIIAYPLAKISGIASHDNNIWLIDERLSSSAEDNGYYFFKYIRENHPYLKVFFILNSKSPHKKGLTGLKNIVDQYSIRHALLLHRAKVLLSTDTFHGLAFPYIFFPKILDRTHNVFLQHGVAGNKKLSFTKLHRPYFNQVIVTNENEKRFFVQEHGFSEDEVSVTGIARFDNLCLNRRASSGKQSILVAPTWRMWLKNKHNIRASKYYSNWNGVLSDSRLHELLDEYDTELIFKPHFNMFHFVSEFNGLSSQIKIVSDANEMLQNYIIETDALLTDYSSIMYDYYYQHKPVICFMFDRDEWEKQPLGSPNIDFERELPADVCFNIDAVIDSLAWYMKNNYELKKEYIGRASQFFKYRDHKNCSRIYSAIVERIS